MSERIAAIVSIVVANISAEIFSRNRVRITAVCYTWNVQLFAPEKPKIEGYPRNRLVISDLFSKSRDRIAV